MKTNFDGKYVIVRCDRAGVFAGVLKEKNGREVILTDCRRLWYWSGANSISQLAKDGTKEPRDCKFTVTVEVVTLPDWFEPPNKLVILPPLITTEVVSTPAGRPPPYKLDIVPEFFLTFT